MKPANKNGVSSLLVLIATAALVVALPSISKTRIVIFMTALGAVVLIYLAAKLRRGTGWARDILLVTSILMTLLAILTLLSGFTLTWLVIGLLSLYLTWSLLKL